MARATLFSLICIRVVSCHCCRLASPKSVDQIINPRPNFINSINLSLNYPYNDQRSQKMRFKITVSLVGPLLLTASSATALCFTPASPDNSQTSFALALTLFAALLVLAWLFFSGTYSTLLVTPSRFLSNTNNVLRDFNLSLSSDHRLVLGSKIPAALSLLYSHYRLEKHRIESKNLVVRQPSNLRKKKHRKD